MQNLPLLPRPLVITASILGKLTPCVQWHGQDFQGQATEEQMLFPLYGEKSELIECVREDLWRVSFLGDIKTWNEKNRFGIALSKSSARDEGRQIVFLHAMEPFARHFFIVSAAQLGVGGRLLSPQSYYNPDYEGEFPKEVPKSWLGPFNKRLQEKWRAPYKDPKCQDIRAAVEDILIY